MSITSEQGSVIRLGLGKAERSHPSVDLTSAAERIRQLHEQVCGRGQRVEITRADRDDVCVLISKRELEALEAAVAIHAATPAHADLCRELSGLLTAAGLVHTPRAYGAADVVQTFADDCAAEYA